MSHYVNYIKEAFGETVVEDSFGFYHYSFYPDYLYINNLYVSTENRGFKIAKRYIREMAKVAKFKKYKQIVGAVSLNNKQSEKVLMTYLRNKCKISSADQHYIYVSIDVEDAERLEA